MIGRKCILYLYLTTVQCFSIGNEFRSEKLPKDFTTAIVDIAAGLPTRAITIVRGNSTNISQDEISALIYALNNNNIGVVYMDLRANNSKSTYYEHQRKGLDTSKERTSFILCEDYECENIISEKSRQLTDINFIHRSMLYIFYWKHGAVSRKFCDSIEEAMRVVVVTRRKHVYRIYYNQATPDRLNHLSLVNWWSGRLYKNPVLPPADKVYKNFRGRVFNVPVLHAPPWHFVIYKNNSSVNVTGGRDDKLLALLAGKLNFKYKYYDPPVRSQGSMISGNGTFKGVLGLIWKRQADFFLGDVTITWERLQAVEFSFLTLADSAAFLTHAPETLSETLVIIRPFQWQVWPLVCATLIVIGPALWFVIAVPTYWQRRHRNMLQLFDECCWFTTTLFLRQTPNKEPCQSNKARLVYILISLGATYVIGDMYSANLTSLMAKPAKEQPIGTLEGLEEAMRERGYELVVEKHSSTLTILQNGTGVYGSLARLMKRQRIQRVRSVEVGVRMVLSRRRVAVLGGRETLYYDTERFGSHNFHLSEKLYTRYSAIALQIGCPYLETFNSVVMTLFEAGILTKMTTDEYKNLPEAARRSEKVTESENRESTESGENGPTSQTQSESTIGLEPVSLRILRGAFCLLGVGYLSAALVLSIELQVYNRSKSINTELIEETRKYRILRRIIIFLSRQMRRMLRAFYRYIDKALAPMV